MVEIYYRQVVMRRNGAGTVEQVAWLPEFLATAGSSIVVSSSVPPEVWLVTDVYGSVRISSSYLDEYKRDHLHQREASDI